ncbi:glycosyltransferase family 39 protein [Candidatus Curtissbacteria bacterium]|nr:glycosyltransferase family 39 protein [Candidatus Curtissbacteria bacterium]
MFSLTENYITRGFWGDEAWTSLISQLPYLQMLKTTAADFHPPAFYTVVELWYKIFPTTEVSTRLISVIFYLLTVFLVYKLVYFIAEERKRFWGLLSAALVLANPIFFQYAFEARNYTLFAFAATGSIYYLIRLSMQRLPRDLWSLVMTKEGLLFIFFSTLGIYTHYYMFFILAAQGLYLILFDRKTFLPVIGAYFVVGLFYLPWVPFLASQVSSVGQSYWIGGIDKRTHYETILRILGGEAQNIARPILFWLTIGLVVIGLVQHIRQKSFERPYILIWLWATVPFILATLPGFRFGEVQFPFRPIFFWRYLIGAAVPLSMVTIHAAQKLPANLFKVTVAAIFALSLSIDYLTLIRYPATFKQIYERDIVGKIGPDDEIVTVLPSFAETLYYRNRFGLENEIIVLPEGLVQFSGKSLLDAYVENGVVTIGEAPESGYFELLPGPSIENSFLQGSSL